MENERVKILEETVHELIFQMASYETIIDTLLARVEELEHRDMVSVDKIKEAFGHVINYL
jgi:hypothetical protein